MSDNGLISIIVPVYNVEEYLERCVYSLINQTYPHLEIILVNDGSTDSSPLMCDQYAQKDPRICVIHKANGGLSDARNTGLQAAAGEYILYVDSDDYIELDTCDRLFSAADHADIVVGAANQILQDSCRIIRHTNILPLRKITAREFVISSVRNREWWSPACLNLYKRKFLLQNNLFFQKHRYFEDTQILPRLFAAARDVVYVDYPFYNYIIRKNSITTSMNNLQKKIQDTLLNYQDWVVQLESMTDLELKRYMYGYLVKLYLHDCSKFRVKGWNVAGLSFGTAFYYALDLREKAKILLFAGFPELYFKMVRLRITRIANMKIFKERGNI